MAEKIDPSDAGSRHRRMPGGVPGRRGGSRTLDSEEGPIAASSWSTSTIRRRALLEYYVTAAVSGALLIVGIVVSLIPSLHKGIPNLSIGAAAVFLVLLSVAFIRFTLARIRYEERQEAVSRKVVGSAIDGLPTKPDFPSLLRVNQTQMDQYHDITKHQAEDAYRNTQVAMAMGLLILLGAAVAAIVLKNAISKIVLAGIAGIGTAFSAYISATFIRVYDSASARRDDYFRQPVVTSYLLAAERLANDENMSQSGRDDARRRIIDAILLQANNYVSLRPAGVPRRNRYFGRRRAPVTYTEMSDQGVLDGVAESKSWTQEHLALDRRPASQQQRMAASRPVQGVDDALVAAEDAQADGNGEVSGQDGDAERGDV